MTYEYQQKNMARINMALIILLNECPLNQKVYNYRE